jgi:hypothetical protein
MSHSIMLRWLSSLHQSQETRGHDARDREDASPGKPAAGQPKRDAATRSAWEQAPGRGAGLVILVLDEIPLPSGAGPGPDTMRLVRDLAAAARKPGHTDVGAAGALRGMLLSASPSRQEAIIARQAGYGWGQHRDDARPPRLARGRGRDHCWRVGSRRE